MSTHTHIDMTTSPNESVGSSQRPASPPADPTRELPPPQRVPPALRIVAIAVVVIVVVGIAYRFFGRSTDENHLEDVTRRDAVLTVSV
jgi:hypothetical protein